MSTKLFPHPELTKITGKPSAVSLLQMKKELYANARSVHSNRGGGARGHLGAIMPPQTYLAYPDVIPFVIPMHPGIDPEHYPNMTQHQITEANRRHTQAIQEHTTYHEVMAALKAQILAAVDARYYNELEEAETGLGDVSCNSILQHLLTQYGEVTRDDIASNTNLLSTAWNPDEPIVDVWTRVARAREFASFAGEPITEGTAITMTLYEFEKVGLMQTATEAWRNLPRNDQTWDRFKAHFNRAEEARARLLTAKTGGYHGANAAKEAPAPTTPTKIAPTQPPNAKANNNVFVYYCWTHGVGFNKAHTSATCTRKADGHKDDATIDNMMDGNNKVMRNTRPVNKHTNNNNKNNNATKKA
jgi:hypothetical protein